MAAVRAGGDRQALHEALRQHSVAAGKRIKGEGADNDMLERLAGDPAFAAVHDQLDALADPQRFIGRAPQQVDAFLDEVVRPRLAGADVGSVEADLRV